MVLTFLGGGVGVGVGVGVGGGQLGLDTVASVGEEEQ